MASKAIIVLVGHVGNVDDLQFTTQGTPVLRFSLAVNTGYGERKTCTWYKCSLFGKQAESVVPYVNKGKNIMIDGEPELEKWESNGKHGANIKVFVKSLTLLGGGEARSNAPATDDDIPF